MTKEELKQEAEEYVSSVASGTAEEMELYARFYIDSAEPREKQIEIDARQIRALQKQNGELTDKLVELKHQLGNLYEIIKRPYQFTAPRKIQMVKEAEQSLKEE